MVDCLSSMCEALSPISGTIHIEINKLNNIWVGIEVPKESFIFSIT